MNDLTRTHGLGVRLTKPKRWLHRRQTFAFVAVILLVAVGIYFLAVSHAARPHTSSGSTSDGGAVSPAHPLPISTLFATGLSSNRHYLVDQNGKPYLLIGDSSWDIGV